MATTFAGMTVQQRTHYHKILLARLLPNTPMIGEGVRADIPKGEGKTVSWRYLAPFALATSALAEDTPPAETALVWTEVTASTAMYGAWAKITALAISQAIDPQVAAAVAAFGENAGQTIHKLLITQLSATDALATNVRYADAVANRAAIAVANTYDSAESRRARRLLARVNVKGYDDGYHALIHPDVMESLIADPLVQSVAQYGSGGVSKSNGVNLLKGQVMEFGGFKYMESTDAPTFTGTAVATVYATLHWGPNWFGEVDLTSDAIGTMNPDTNRLSGLDPIVIPADTDDKADPLKQYGVVGWRVLGWASKILQAERGLRVESSAAA